MTTKALERQVGRVFSPLHCGDLANLKIFGRDIGIAIVTTAVQAGYLSPLLLEGLAIPPS